MSETIDLFNDHQLETVLEDQGLLQYQSNFLQTSQCMSLLEQLPEQLCLQQEPIRLFGKSVLQPRLSGWVADSHIEYAYSGLNSPAQTWPDSLTQVREQLSSRLQKSFNGVLCNYYRDGDDYMGWHSDNERALGHQPIIASISIGAERRFDIRKKGQKDYRSIVLQSGSLLLMSGDMQQYWEHRLPKDKKIHSPRVNLTFRHIKFRS